MSDETLEIGRTGVKLRKISGEYNAFSEKDDHVYFTSVWQEIGFDEPRTFVCFQMGTAVHEWFRVDVDYPWMDDGDPCPRFQALEHVDL